MSKSAFTALQLLMEDRLYPRGHHDPEIPDLRDLNAFGRIENSSHIGNKLLRLSSIYLNVHLS